jgi:hypothetical protein
VRDLSVAPQSSPIVVQPVSVAASKLNPLAPPFHFVAAKSVSSAAKSLKDAHLSPGKPMGGVPDIPTPHYTKEAPHNVKQQAADSEQARIDELGMQMADEVGMQRADEPRVDEPRVDEPRVDEPRVDELRAAVEALRQQQRALQEQLATEQQATVTWAHQVHKPLVADLLRLVQRFGNLGEASIEANIVGHPELQETYRVVQTSGSELQQRVARRLALLDELEHLTDQLHATATHLQHAEAAQWQLAHIG